MAQVTGVVSEALQAKVRALLPSQQGFTEDLQAQNVIVPIIDLTETASGSTLRQDLQTALNLGGATTFRVTGTTSTVISTTGFYSITFVSTINAGNNQVKINNISITDGTTTKAVFEHNVNTTATQPGSSTTQGNFVFYLNSGESMTIFTNSDCCMAGSVRQIADLNGNLVNPTGFTSE